MSKKLFPLIFLVVVILIIGGYFIFKGKSKTGGYQIPSGYQIPEQPSQPETKDVFPIKGIGFKKESWAEYKMEGYGFRIQGGKEERKVGKILVKLISLPIKGKEYYGIEIDGKENSPFEGGVFAMVFEKNGQGSYYLAKIKGAPTLCMSEKISGYEDVPEYFDRKSIESEYKVDLTIWRFVGEDEMTLESGKKIKVYKFKMDMGGYGTRELWLSPEVPTYLVLNRETLEGKSRSITLTNFGMDGGLPNLTDEDLKACDSEGGGLPQLPGLPSELSKMFCQTDADCACGVDKKTGKCAFGNKKFIDTSRQCPDFCEGIAGNIRIKCIDNVCTPQIIK